MHIKINIYVCVCDGIANEKEMGFVKVKGNLFGCEFWGPLIGVAGHSFDMV